MSSSLSFATAVQHAADGFDGVVDPLRHLAIDGFELASAGGNLVQFASQPGAVAVERMDLADQRLLAAVGLAPPLYRGIQCFERTRQTQARSFNRIGFAHAPIRVPQWAQNLCDDKAL